VFSGRQRISPVVSQSDIFPSFITYNGWTLTHNDQDENLEVLDKMKTFSVTHAQLKIQEMGGQMIVWAQELAYETATFNFDLTGEDMQARMAAYRYALGTWH